MLNLCFADQIHYNGLIFYCVSPNLLPEARPSYVFVSHYPTTDDFIQIDIKARDLYQLYLSNLLEIRRYSPMHKAYKPIE